MDQDFNTTDENIFGAGSMCEFSRRCVGKSASSSKDGGMFPRTLLRHDGYNGSEVGKRLASTVLKKITAASLDEEAAFELGASSKGLDNETTGVLAYKDEAGKLLDFCKP